MVLLVDKLLQGLLTQLLSAYAAGVVFATTLLVLLFSSCTNLWAINPFSGQAGNVQVNFHSECTRPFKHETRSGANVPYFNSFDTQLFRNVKMKRMTFLHARQSVYRLKRILHQLSHAYPHSKLGWFPVFAL